MSRAPRSAPETEGSRQREVERAIAELRRAREEAERLRNISADVGITSDGTEAMRQATRKHAAALKKLRDAVRRFDEEMEKRYPARPTGL